MAQRKYTFAQAQLDSSNRLIYTHNLNTEDVIPFLKDNTGRAFPITDIFSNGDVTSLPTPGANAANIISIEFPDAIPGTWTLLLEYTAASEVSSGRRAFELSVNNSPDEDFRLIFGKADTPSANITFTNFFTYLMGKLGFLKVANNLSDLADAGTGRTNLGVYSSGEVDTALATKATIYQTGSGAVLGVANTAVYVPSANYHPATKKYIDDFFTLRNIKGNYAVGDIDGDGYQEFTVSLGVTLSSANYKVLGEILEPTSNRPSAWGILSKANNSFVLWIWARDSSAAQNITFNWELAPL